MQMYKKVIASGILLSTILFSLHILAGIHPGWTLAPLILVVLTLVWGSSAVGSGMYMKVVCNGDHSSPLVALTFDDGPAEHSTAILEILEAHKIKGTFFVTGSKAQAHPDLIRSMHAAGHTIGNHTYSHHFWFDLFSASRMQRELEETNRIIEAITGKKVKWFRPPYGVTNPNLARAVKSVGLKAVGWDVRSLDTVTRAGNKVFERILRKVRPGSIILLHDTSAIAAEILPTLIGTLRQRGLDIVSMDELIGLERNEH
jgi:peptidoglycan/xylan/chitin deacetylase (PgdA/CDA1 family)